MYLKTSFSSIFSTSLAIMLVAMLTTELLSSGNGESCFTYHRTFRTSSLSREDLASFAYSKINIQLKVEVTAIDKSHNPF